MHRYYMTPETQQAVLAESNRQIATRAAIHAFRKQVRNSSAGELDSEWPASEGDTETAASGLDSAFARLVSDLESTSAGSRRS